MSFLPEDRKAMAMMFNCNMMKVALVAASAVSAVLFMVSCNGESVPDSDAGRSTVSFVVGTSGTRASVTPHEREVASLDVLVFRSGEGTLDNSARVVAGNGALDRVSVELTRGVALDWFVVANAPEGALSSCTSEAAFLRGLTLLEHSTASSLVMHAGGVLPSGPVADDVPVALDRYACKVTVESVTVDWPDAFAMATEVRLGRIVLVNVVGSTPLSGVPDAGDLWYNRMGVDASLPALVADMTVKDYGGLALPASTAVGVAFPLYCMPNPVNNGVTSKDEPSWSPRNTRVAVELLLDGVSEWYPIDLPSMQGNTHYLIRSLTVTGPGSKGPDWPVERDDVRFSVSVVPWVDGEVVPVYL